MLTNQKLVLQYISFADKIAKSQFRKMPPQVQFDELKSAAYMGLVDAASRYVEGNFENFARFRIIGEIKDYLRSLKWDRNTNKLASIPEGYDIAVSDPESFDEILDDFTRNRISPLSKRILKMYYGEGLTISNIAEKVNLSGARISQLIKQSISTIKSACA